MAKAPNDKKNIEYIRRLRYTLQSGQSSIHGDTNFQVLTQEGQSLSFHQSTGQGASEGGGPGTGKHILTTPGMSMEVLGSGLKVRDPGDTTMLPTKIIKAKRGDMIFECENGDITLRARNIFIDANGGGQDGQFTVKAERIADIGAPDIRVQGEKITVKASKDMTVIAKGQFELKYGFMVAAAFADERFGALTANLKKTQLSTMRTL
mgnify:FL=1|tara:strand:- start:111 stop:731 length:621 start_codon:yes stop_codon:yes gene_type:complete